MFPRPEKWCNPLSDNMVIMDLETTGLDVCKAKAIMIGLLVVKDGKISKEKSIDLLIKTPYSPEVWGAAYKYHPMAPQLLQKLDQYGLCHQSTFDAIDLNGGSIMGCPAVPQEIQDMRDINDKLTFRTAVDATGITPEHTMEYGMDRKDALDILYRILLGAMRTQCVIAGHNIVNFDLPFLSCEFPEELGVDESELDINENLLLDTGMIVKAAQLGLYPYKNESNAKFFHRIYTMQRRAKWSLDKFCVPNFSLDRLYGVDSNEQHKSAGYDCWVTGCLINEFAKQTVYG